MKKTVAFFSTSMLLFSQLILPITTFAESSTSSFDTTDTIQNENSPHTSDSAVSTALTQDTATVSSLDTPTSPATTTEAQTKTVQLLADDPALDSWMPDKNLQAIIAAELGKTDFTQEDLKSITSISIDQATITTFKGVEYATNLAYVSLTNTDLSATDMSDVSNLSNLKEAILTNDNLSDASFIFNNQLTSLEKIDVSYNKFTNLNSLKGLSLHSLTTLNISHNELSDISIIQNVDVPNLATLDASYNSIRDISAITSSSLSGLTTLDVSYNQISDISAIENTTLTSLVNLTVSHNNISDISAIAHSKMTEIVNLDASYNAIQDVNAFANSSFTKLETLDVSNNEISDISVMKNLTDRYPNLHTYKVDNNHIYSIEFMEGYQLASNTSAQNQTYEKTISILKPTTTELTDYEIAVPITSLNYQYDGTSGYYVGQPDPTAETLTLSNITGATTLNYTDGTNEPLSGNDTSYTKVRSFVIDASKTTLPDEITFSWNGAQGQYSGNATVHINWIDAKEPVIDANDQTIFVGDSFDPKNVATAYDQQDDGSARTDLTDNLEILSNSVDPTKPGTYTVKYGVTNNYGLSTTKLITVTVVAKTYTISFDPNGGTGTLADLSMTEGQEQALPKNTFIKTGYTFKGWATTPTGAVAYKDQQIVNNLVPENQAKMTKLASDNQAKVTLYAVWEKDPETMLAPATPKGSTPTTTTSTNTNSLPTTGEKTTTWLMPLGMGLLISFPGLFIWKRKKVND